MSVTYQTTLILAQEGQIERKQSFSRLRYHLYYPKSGSVKRSFFLVSSFVAFNAYFLAVFVNVHFRTVKMKDWFYVNGALARGCNHFRKALMKKFDYTGSTVKLGNTNSFQWRVPRKPKKKCVLGKLRGSQMGPKHFMNGAWMLGTVFAPDDEGD